MAILDKLEVSIIVNERLAPEFENHETDPDSAARIVRFIEAADDVPFGIRIAIRDSMEIKSTSLSFRIFIDGKWARSRLFNTKDYLLHPQQKYICDVHVVNSTGWESSPFLFHAVETGRSDYFLKAMSLLKAPSGRCR